MEYWVEKGRLIFDCKTNKLKYIGTSRVVARQAASSVECLEEDTNCTDDRFAYVSCRVAP